MDYYDFNVLAGSDCCCTGAIPKTYAFEDYLFTSDEQSIVEDVLVVLKPIKKATLLVSGEKQPSTSKILPTLTKLRTEMTVDDKDSEIIKAMKTKAIENSNKGYKDEKVSSFVLKASFLDPRYKSLNSIAKPGVMLLIKQEMRDMCVCWLLRPK